VFRLHLQPSSRPREPYTKIHKHGLNHFIKKSKLLLKIEIIAIIMNFYSILRFVDAIFLEKKVRCDAIAIPDYDAITS